MGYPSAHLHPYPFWWETHTHTYGYGFVWARAQATLILPMGYPCSSLTRWRFRTRSVPHTCVTEQALTTHFQIHTYHNIMSSTYRSNQWLINDIYICSGFRGELASGQYNGSTGQFLSGLDALWALSQGTVGVLDFISNYSRHSHNAMCICC